MDFSSYIDECTKKLTPQVQSEPWVILKHGRAVLQTEEQLNAYIAAYGEMHEIKCRAALQNFPFDNLSNFEIIDWGCGQGIATIVLIEMLKDRRKLSFLRKITLIEPSQPALSRAINIIRRVLGIDIEIVAINKYLPNNYDDNNFPLIRCFSPCVIHLFSNILDIHTISLKWIADRVSMLGREKYVVCVGPKFGNNKRIEDFCGYLQPEQFFSKISQYPYAYTSKTRHAFGCTTACFYLPSYNINKNYVETDTSNDVYDEYNYTTDSLRGIIDEQVIIVYNLIRKQLNPEDSIFIKPNIFTETVDLVIVRPHCGVALFNVITPTNTMHSNVNSVYFNLIDMYLKDMKERVVTNKSVFRVIKRVEYYPSNDNPNTEVFNYVRQIKGDISRIDDILSKIELKYNDRLFDDKLYDDIMRLIVKGWHSYKDGVKNFQLTPRQKKLSVSEARRQKIKGCAGAGKTQVLACRAVNSLVRTGGNVLILTFNITLINYIKYRMNQVPADFSWNNIYITNYHQFFKTQASVFCPRPQIDDWNNPNFFINEETERYDAVFVDEGQDYLTNWYQLIINSFLKDNGEFVVFADGRQNIYRRELDAEKQPKVPTILGKWTELKDSIRDISFRIENHELVRLATKFQETFFDYVEPFENNQGALSFSNYYLRYWNIGEVNAKSICDNLLEIIRKFKLETKDIVVLSQTIGVLRDVDNEYRSETGQETMITFEKKEVYDEVMLHSQYRDRDLESIRRTKKVHFTTDSESIKMSTIHSFKGWESNTIILVLQRDGLIEEEGERTNSSSAALVYTALTRAKRNLFILNLGNTKYHSFFEKNINMKT